MSNGPGQSTARGTARPVAEDPQPVRPPEWWAAPSSPAGWPASPPNGRPVRPAQRPYFKKKGPFYHPPTAIKQSYKGYFVLFLILQVYKYRNPPILIPHQFTQLFHSLYTL